MNQAGNSQAAGLSQQRGAVLGAEPPRMTALAEQTNRIYGLLNDLENETCRIENSADRLISNHVPEQKAQAGADTVMPSSHDWVLRDIGNRLERLLGRTGTLSQRLNEAI